MVREMNTADFRAALKDKKTLVVDFWAAWCGPCRMLGPVLDALSEEYGEKADFVKVNVDDNPDVAEEYGIMSIPCVMVFKNGELAGKNVGFVPKETMREFIDKNI